MLEFENDAQRLSNKRSYLENVEIKDYNVMTDANFFFDELVKNNTLPYENIRKITIGLGNSYATGYLLNYAYFREKMIAIDLSKQHALDADPKAVQQIIFIENLDRTGNTKIYFHS